jgi:hypothetical protein
MNSERGNHVNGERISVNGRQTRRAIHSIRFTVHAFVSLFPLTTYRSPLTAQIQDNSFLIEEAYNQESGVVQHISALQRTDNGDWGYSFTQEWPLGGIRHQISYTVPVEHTEGFGTGVGDVGINYRYQLTGSPDARTVMAPRLTLLLPTGSEEQGRGAGSVGIEGNVPLTLALSPRFVTHWNAGATVTPSARNPVAGKATTLDFNLGVSAIWLLRPALNLVVEAVWLSEESVIDEGRSQREQTTLLNPGIRAAFDVGALQIVPGIAYTIDLSSEEPTADQDPQLLSAEDGIFLYLSFEHPFKRQ